MDSLYTWNMDLVYTLDTWNMDLMDTLYTWNMGLVDTLYTWNMGLTLKLPTTTTVAQPFNVIKWQLKFNPVA